MTAAEILVQRHLKISEPEGSVRDRLGSVDSLDEYVEQMELAKAANPAVYGP